MIFNTSNALSIDKKDVAFLEGGIHENVSFVGVRKEKSVNGNLFIEFEFSKDGSKVTHTEYEPKQFSDQTAEAFQEKANKQIWRLLHIMSPWFTKEQLSNFEASDFDGIYTWVATMMNTADKSKLLRIKVNYGDTGYTSLPKYTGYTFIEAMDITADKSKIKKLGIDQFDRPELGDKEKPAASSATVFGSTPITAPQTAGTGLPF
jgi:hypothetical protein